MGDARLRTTLKYTRKNYSTSSEATRLNTVDIWQPENATRLDTDEKLWLIYIHGGAWRDPAVDSQSFEPALNEIWNSALQDSIAGFASINYRLSPYPSHPKYPSSPDDTARNVQHPTHMLDVGQALLYLEEELHIARRYLLIGHSAGGTLTFQMNDQHFLGAKLPVPAAVLGVSGIYNFDAFVENHKDVPAYQQFMTAAFPDREGWHTAAPFSSHLAIPSLWEQTKAVLIAHSDQDELVEKEQASFMLSRAQASSFLKEKVHYLPASGHHDEIWGSGYILAGLIASAVSILNSQ